MIEEIEGRLKKFRHDWEISRGCCDVEDFSKDIEYLLSLVKKQREVIEITRDKSQILASHCAVQLDRGGNVSSSYSFEKSQEIYELLQEALKE